MEKDALLLPESLAGMIKSAFGEGSQFGSRAELGEREVGQRLRFQAAKGGVNKGGKILWGKIEERGAQGCGRNPGGLKAFEQRGDGGQEGSRRINEQESGGARLFGVRSEGFQFASGEQAIEERLGVRNAGFLQGGGELGRGEQRGGAEAANKHFRTLRPVAGLAAGPEVALTRKDQIVQVSFERGERGLRRIGNRGGKRIE
jgi:hypothetical protein